tara:strand:- start:332 stop:589 length:258 start_codon:yes stop_codon:yes gene_type:complete
MSKKTVTDLGRGINEFAYPLIKAASKEFGFRINPKFKKVLKSYGSKVGKNVSKMPEMAKMMNSGGSLKRKRPIDGIAQRGKTRAR